MIKQFFEALRDGFARVRPSSGQAVKELRADGVLVDEEGYFSYAFGDHKEYELCLEPILEDEHENPGYLVALYKNRVSLINKLPVWIKKEEKK